jgi:chemotaxis protein methyltransferase CheR
VIERIAASLVPGGHLFLGHAETLRGLSTAFDLCHDHGTFYYRRTTGLTGPAETDGQPLVDLVEEAGAWVDAVRLATGRVAELTGAAGTPEPIPRWDLGRPLALLRQERFGEALEAVEALPPVAAGDADVLLLHAALLTHGGQLERAEDACGRLLDLDPLSAGAHYLLALCREAVGDLEAAVECDRLAVHLDPGFAMPRVHLGLLARRVGDTAAVHDEMARAVTALQDEDASRLLIFGGGFTREALAALCRAEMAAVGALP